MESFMFGAQHEGVGLRGRPKVWGDWALSIQCSWRLSRLDKIVVGYRDVYSARTHAPGKGSAGFDSDQPGQNRRDELLERFFVARRAAPVSVKDIRADDLGGFTLSLTDPFRLEVFPDESPSDAELWRLFQPGIGARHFVVSRIAAGFD